MLLIDRKNATLGHQLHTLRFIKVDDDRGIAERYFARQQPLVLAAARRFVVHPYFARLAKLSVPLLRQLAAKSAERPLKYEHMVTQRLVAMHTLLSTAGADDYRVEKDKCEMYRFFNRSGLPYSAILAEWHDPRAMAAELTQLRVRNASSRASSRASSHASSHASSVFEAARRWPLFLKCCHLTQGSMQSTRPLSSREWLAKHTDEVLQWAAEKFKARADDKWRATKWRTAGNALTAVLRPGFLLQSPAHLAQLTESGEQAVFELKVDVVWGRAYIAALLVNNRFPQITWALRGHSEGAAVPYDPSDPSGAFHTALEWGSSHWVFSEGHMPCVWALAERTARAMGADQVRIDIFVARHRQEGCVLNELSLSSGNPLGAHDHFLARAWLQPWLSRAYRVGLSTLPVYGIRPNA